MELVRGMKAVVLGCGTAGLSVVRFLLDQGVEVAVSETGSEKSLGKKKQWLDSYGISYECGGHTERFVSAADIVVPSPGIPLEAPILKFIRQRQIPVVGELGLAAGRFDVPVIAVTGSNGKTTVTALTGELLRHHFGEVFVGGNIGTPLLDYFSSSGGFKAAVLELSSFQLELIGEFRPDVSVILNVTPDHLDRHHTMEKYLDAKLNLIKNQIAGDVVILGGDDPVLSSIAAGNGINVKRFGSKTEFDSVTGQEGIRLHRAGREDDAGILFSLTNTAMHSSVNRLNAAAAVLAASCLDCGWQEISCGLVAFTPPPHRMAEVALVDGVRYINDSKATNVGALQAALSGSEAPVVLIAGGRDKQGDFLTLRELVAAKVRHLILMGEAARTMKEVLGDLVELTIVSDMNEAVAIAAEKACIGDIVLLAPGCASFDMFSGYEHRGRVFTEAVLEYNEGRERTQGK